MFLGQMFVAFDAPHNAPADVCSWGNARSGQARLRGGRVPAGVFPTRNELADKGCICFAASFLFLIKMEQTQRIDKHQLFILSALRIGHI